jgi:large subunit ribosomal protein L13
MDMNKAFFLRKEDSNPAWVVIDAKDQVLGRMATKIADMLRGKDVPQYTPHADAGKYVVVINADKIVLTGNKWTDKLYYSYTGYKGGFRTISARDLQAKKPTELVHLAVKRMMPDTPLSRANLSKLKIYVGTEHPHKAQVK